MPEIMTEGGTRCTYKPAKKHDNGMKKEKIHRIKSNQQQDSCDSITQFLTLHAANLSVLDEMGYQEALFQKTTTRTNLRKERVGAFIVIMVFMGGT